MRRVVLIVPVDWRGKTITAITFEPLTSARLEEIRSIARRFRPSRKSVRKAVAIAADIPISLVNRLADVDLSRAEDAVAMEVDLCTDVLIGALHEQTGGARG